MIKIMELRISENDKTTLVAEKEGGLGCGNALVHIRTHHWIFQRYHCIYVLLGITLLRSMDGLELFYHSQPQPLLHGSRHHLHYHKGLRAIE